MSYEHSMPVESASYFVGDHMLLQCIKGFTNIGTKQQFCSESGRWSAARPHCVGKLCFDAFTLVCYDDCWRLVGSVAERRKPSFLRQTLIA